jgi:ribonuclease-3
MPEYDEAVADQHPDPLAELEELLGHRFEDRELLARAVRHGSATNALAEGSYQRLEFLGDAVLNHAVAELLFFEYPDHDQGDLTRKRAHLTQADTLSTKAALLGLDRFIELGPSEEANRGWERYALLEDVFEAVIGALAVDAGWDRAYEFVYDQFVEELDGLDERTLTLANPKTALQEAAQARGLPLPVYRDAGVTGPDHERRWAFHVIWDGEELSRGEGRSKRDAQQRAARRALVRLGLVPEE